jgi:hypothetical protein
MLSVSQTIKSRMKGRCVNDNWKERSWPNLRYYSGIYFERLSKTTRNLRQDSQSPGRDFNPGPPENETRILTTRPRLRQVVFFSEYYLGGQIKDDAIGVKCSTHGREEKCSHSKN